MKRYSLVTIAIDGKQTVRPLVSIEDPRLSDCLDCESDLDMAVMDLLSEFAGFDVMEGNQWDTAGGWFIRREVQDDWRTN